MSICSIRHAERFRCGMDNIRCVSALFLVNWILEGRDGSGQGAGSPVGRADPAASTGTGYVDASSLGGRIGARNSTVVRLEQGAFAAPSPDKLARIAEVLGITLADVYGHAGYAVPDDLPEFHAYLPARYRDMPKAAVKELTDLFDSLVVRHSLTPQLEQITTGTGARSDVTP